MKIWGDIPKIFGTYGKQKKVANSDKIAALTSKRDEITISSKARDFQSIIKIVKTVPDIRQDKVNELLKVYESGNYNISGKEVADSILKSMIDKKA